jgi:hypothetical protein
MQRLIKPKDIPRSMWWPEQKRIHLAPDLVSAWQKLLDYTDLTEKALQPVPENIVGGLTKESTDEHLAWRFSGSSARVQLGLLDPGGKLSGVSDAFARIFSGGTVLIADLPCGSGAAVLTILSTIAELRRTGRIPREPLHIRVVGGEISEFARDYANTATNHIKASLAEQAIWVSAEFIHWNALDKFSTADLNNKLATLGQNCTARLLVLANFSGFLQGEGKWKLAIPQFDSLFIHCRNNESFAIWIEPQTNKVLAKGGFFGRVIGWFNELFASFQTPEERASLNLDNLEKSSAQVQHPLRPEQQFDVNLVVQRFDLPKLGPKL